MAEFESSQGGVSHIATRAQVLRIARYSEMQSHAATLAFGASPRPTIRSRTMTISPVMKGEFLRSLSARRLRGVSLVLVQAIVERINATPGIAFANYSKYASDVGRERQVAERTIPALSRLGLPRKHARRNGPPVLWFPDLMDMTPDEAVRRVEWCVRHQGEDPSAYFTGGYVKNDVPCPGYVKNDVSGYVKNDVHNPISNNLSLRERGP